MYADARYIDAVIVSKAVAKKSSSIVGIVVGVLLLLVAVSIAVAVLVKRKGEDPRHVIPRTSTLTAMDNPTYEASPRAAAIVNATYDSFDAVGPGVAVGAVEMRPRLFTVPWAEGEANGNGAYIATDWNGHATAVPETTGADGYEIAIAVGSPYAPVGPPPGTTGADGYEIAAPYAALADTQVYGGSAQFYDRVIAANSELYDPVYTMNPLSELELCAVVSLATAVESAVVHCGGEFDDCIAYAEEASSNLDRTDPTIVLDHEDGATVHLYTQETPLYHGLNGALGGWGKGGRAEIPHYLPATKLLLRALRQIPVEPCVTLYRGVLESADTLLGGCGVGDEITWWSFTSASKSPDVLRDENFLGIGKKAAKKGARTVFQIRADAGINIQPYSAIPGEDEVMLLPGSTFRIDKITVWAYGLIEVQMHQVASANFATGVMEASPYGSIAPVYTPINEYMMPTPLLGAGQQLPDYAPEAATDAGSATAYATVVEDVSSDYHFPDPATSDAGSATAFATVVEDVSSDYHFPDPAGANTPSADMDFNGFTVDESAYDGIDL